MGGAARPPPCEDASVDHTESELKCARRRERGRSSAAAGGRSIRGLRHRSEQRWGIDVVVREPPPHLIEDVEAIQPHHDARRSEKSEALVQTEIDALRAVGAIGIAADEA